MKAIMSPLLFWIFLCWKAFSIPLFPQSPSYIDGKVINSATLNPLPFATIKLKINNLGVFANANGDFKIICNPKFQSDSLIITCIGFQRCALPFKDLSEREINNIYLTPAIYGLGEVRIVALKKKMDAEAIIRKAIKNINKNYPVKPFSYVSYYRDYQKKGKKYINLNEAIVQTLDAGFNNKATLNKFRLLEFRQNTDFPRLNISQVYDTISYPDFDYPDKFIPKAKLPDQGGNELFILMVHDAIRNFQTASFSFVDTLAKNFISNHVFSGVTPIYNNNLLLYKISFNGKHKLTGDSLIVFGDITIQPEDYSIHKFEYSGAYLQKGNRKKEMFNVDIEYGYENSVDSLMCLKYISFNNIFNVVDTADTTYFRVLKSHLDPADRSNSTLIIEFNNLIDAKSAVKKEDYEIFYEDRKAKILNIDIVDRKAIIRVKEEKIQSPRITCSVRNIKDINGKILNRKNIIEFYQYRELFIQEYNKPMNFKDSCYLQNVPLLQNCISRYAGDKKYWMNTPVNANIE